MGFFPQLLLEIKENMEGKMEWVEEFRERGLVWRLKLVSAIVLEHKGVDYSEFGLAVLKKFPRHSVKELKIMGQTKNPATFEKMFDTSSVVVSNHVETRPVQNRLKECDLCDFKTRHNRCLTKHKAKKHEGKLLSCDYCPYQAKELGALQEHREKVHIPQI